MFRISIWLFSVIVALLLEWPGGSAAADFLPLLGSLAALAWLFPAASVEQLFGIFDPFRNADKPRLPLLGWLARRLDAHDRRRFGQANRAGGGWA